MEQKLKISLARTLQKIQKLCKNQEICIAESIRGLDLAIKEQKEILRKLAQDIRKNNPRTSFNPKLDDYSIAANFFDETQILCAKDTCYGSKEQKNFVAKLKKNKQKIKIITGQPED